MFLEDVPPSTKGFNKIKKYIFPMHQAEKHDSMVQYNLKLDNDIQYIQTLSLSPS